MTTYKNNKNETWFLLKSGKKEGPYFEEDIKKMIELNQITQKSYLWKPGLTNWMAAISFPVFFESINIEPNSQSHIHEKNEAMKNQSTLLPKPSQIDSTFHNINNETYSKQPVPNHKRKSYLSRHWNGEFPLPFSFWINGAFLNILIYVVMRFAPWDILVNNSLRIASIVMILIIVSLLPLSIWQLIGIWRSANHYIKNGRSKLVGNFVRFILIVSTLNSVSIINKSGIPQIKEFFNLAIGNDSLGTYQIRLLSDSTELEITGFISFGLTKDVEKMLKDHPTIQIIHLNSQGGRIHEARKLRDFIDSRNLTTSTTSGCFSACTLAYAGGYKRLISKNASLGFHQYRFLGIPKPNFNHEYEKDKKDWSRRGFSKSFIDKAYSIPNNEIWKPSHEELLEAGFITGFLESNEIAISGLQLKTIENIEKEFGTNPLFLSIKNYEPEIFDQMISKIQNKFQKGKSLAEFQRIIYPFLVVVYQKRLPYASDDSIYNDLKINIEAIQILYRTNPDICFNYLYAQDQEKLDVLKYFSDELLQKEVASMSEVICSPSIQINNTPNIEQIEEKLMTVLIKIAANCGEDVQLLSNPELRNKNKAKSCQIVCVFFQELLKLPLNDFGELFRYLHAPERKKS